jgi:hypothetical protein
MPTSAKDVEEMMMIPLLTTGGGAAHEEDILPMHARSVPCQSWKIGTCGPRHALCPCNLNMFGQTNAT